MRAQWVLGVLRLPWPALARGPGRVRLPHTARAENHAPRDFPHAHVKLAK